MNGAVYFINIQPEFDCILVHFEIFFVVVKNDVAKCEFLLIQTIESNNTFNHKMLRLIMEFCN